MPPPPPPLDFTDTEFSSDYFPAILSGSPGCYMDMEWLTPSSDFNFTTLGGGGGGGDDLSANHLQDEQHDYTGNSMVVQQFGNVGYSSSTLGSGGGEEFSGDHQVVESGDNDGINNTRLVVKKQTRRRSVVKKKTAFERIKKERLELHYGKILSEAAKSLEVSVPTLKRTCRKHGIASWPLCKKKKKDLSTEISNIDEVQPFPAELRTVIAKVKYGDNFIKLEISSLSNLAVLQEEITKRLNLKDGSFDIKYVDKDGDLVLIKLDADVWMCMKNLDTPKVNMEVLLCSN